MIAALFITIVVVSMPIAAIVVVSMASRREEAEWSLGEPAHGMVQATARRLLDFHSEGQAWPVPKNAGQAVPTATHSMAKGSVAHPRSRSAIDTPRPAATSKVSVGTAA